MSKKKQEDPHTLKTFKEKFHQAAYTGWSYEKTFDDFLTMIICSFSRNYETGLSFYEDEYLKIIESYKQRNTLKYFPELLAILIMYMEKYKDSGSGNDLLGDFFGQEISKGRNGQYFTPFPICMFMAQITQEEEAKSMNVLDPSCGSGRMLMAHGKQGKQRHKYWGIDIDPMCVKIAAVNLFLNGLSGEVMCANALNPDDFRFSYRISHYPLGMFKIEQKEESRLWHMMQMSFPKKQVGQLKLFDTNF